jgi:hypothetical protein
MTLVQKQPFRGSERGSAMLAALCLAMVFAISLSSYIAVCYASLNMSTRSIAMAHSSELAEAGIEQALYSLNNSDWSMFTISGSTATANLTMTSTGFALTSGSPTPLNFGNGVNGTVKVSILNYTNYQTNSAPGPSISAQAVMTLPSYAGSAAGPTVSTTTSYSASTGTMTSATPVFVNAVAATTGTVRFRTAGSVDSFDSVSAIGAYQTYATATATTRGYSAIILSQDDTTAAATVRLGSAVIYGYAVGYNYASPSSTNWLSYGAAGKIVGPNTLPATFIDTTRLVTNPAPYQPSVIENLPIASALPLPAACTTDSTTINKTATLGSPLATAPVVYDAGTGINLASQTLTIQGPVVIICYSDVTLSGTGNIVLTTPQASLQIFLEYGNLNLGGNGITNTNAVPLPKKVCILSTTNQWGTATFTAAANSIPSAFYGEIYLPYMTLSVTSSPWIYGSIVAKSVSFTGSPTIHYDLELRKPTSSYTQFIPLQSGAAFDNLTAPPAFTGLVTSNP